MDTNEETSSANNLQLSLRDEVKRLNPVKLSGKPKSLDLMLGNGGELRIAVNFGDNCVRLFNMQTSIKVNSSLVMNLQPICLIFRNQKPFV